MEPSKEAIAVRLTRLNRQILGKVTSAGANSFNKKTIDREALLDALTVLYDECNDDPVKKTDELVRLFVDKYRSTLAELRRTRVCIADFDLIQLIGYGQFGDVHMVREKQTGDVYALKTVKKEIAAKRSSTAVDIERDVLAMGAGPWLPKLQYAFQDNKNLYLVMELCSGGDLAGLLSRRNHPLCERDAAFYVAEVAHALRAIHDLGFVHRDVKPQNVFLDRTGHVKLGDLGSSCRLSEGGTLGVAAGVTAEYAAPEVLAAAICAMDHAVCHDCCKGIQPAPITACDYWSLGVIAFELVTLKRPFSDTDDDSVAVILSNIQRYEDACLSGAGPPFSEPFPSSDWVSLTAGLLTPRASRRFHYMDTTQHVALQHISPHCVREQPPPWVPSVRGCEDPSHFPAPPSRARPPPSAAPFRTRVPFDGQLPFVGFSYVSPEESEESLSSGFNASHDCTAIDLATFKSAEKLAVLRGREISSLQSALASAEAKAAAKLEQARTEAERENERERARLQADITALSLQNKRLERQLEVEKDERLAVERTNQELKMSNGKRQTSELKLAEAKLEDLRRERSLFEDQVRRLEARVSQLQADGERARADADAARAQQKHYKEIIKQAQDLRHRRLTEINVRPIDSIAKERALRRQTLCGLEAESAARNTAKQTAKDKEYEQAITRSNEFEAANRNLQIELDETKRALSKLQETFDEKKYLLEKSNENLKAAQAHLTQERLKSSTLAAQTQELQRALSECQARSSALEEQCARTESRLQQRLSAAEDRAALALKDDARHREKVQTLEQLVRQLERDVSALEARKGGSDTESTHDLVSKEKDEAAIQARADEIAALRQEARAANLARWRKEREHNELTVELKSSTRELKRLEDRLTYATESRKTAEQKASELKMELDKIKPEHELVTKELEVTKQMLERLQKRHDVVQAEVDRSRNDILKLKSELQYSEKRRIRAEQQEELGAKERAQLRDEHEELRATAAHVEQNNKALQEACTLLEEQLTDLEKLADLHEIKNKELENERIRLREELSAARARADDAERGVKERGGALGRVEGRLTDTQIQLQHCNEQLHAYKERVSSLTDRVQELESSNVSLESELASLQAAVSSGGRRVRALQEECAALRTSAYHHHQLALKTQARLNDTQEELEASREASEAAAAWWRTRETKADATLRQQAKLIDFLQAKVEEANRKKCSLGHKLFGRSGRRGATVSPPLRRANRELREEVDRLRTKLSKLMLESESVPATPKRDASRRQKSVFATPSIDTSDGMQHDNSIQVLWSEGPGRERISPSVQEGALVLPRGGRAVRASLTGVRAQELPRNEADRAFTVKVENPSDGPSTATIICSSVEQRADLVSKLDAAPAQAGYSPQLLARVDAPAYSALYLAPNVMAICTTEGMQSLRGPIELDCDFPLEGVVQAVCVAGRVVLRATGGQHGGQNGGSGLAHASLLSLSSALRRAAALKPTIEMQMIELPGSGPFTLLQPSLDENVPALALSRGRAVVVLRWEGSKAAFLIERRLTLDRPPASLLLTKNLLLIAGERPLKLPLPSGAIETFAADDMVVSSASRRRSPPLALLATRRSPIEILVCYGEGGIFLDEKGARTRSEDVKWPTAAKNFAYVEPFIYLIGTDKVTILHLSEDAYKAPPCTCDDHSIASTPTDSYSADKYELTLEDVQYLGTSPNGIIISSKIDKGYTISLVEGMMAFRSVGASVESLATTSDPQGSCSDLAPSVPDAPRSPDTSQDSIEPKTGFLADIRKRAQQLRKKNRSERSEKRTPDDVIKTILTTEVGLKRNVSERKGRMSPATISDTSESESESDNEIGADKTPADLCAEMFTRQVRFQ